MWYRCCVKYYVQETGKGTGKGLFAGIPYRPGAFIIEYTGVKIPNDVADALTTRYLFELDDTWTIDAEDESHTARYINHDCHPNAEASIESGRIIIRACVPISPGDELTIDYGAEHFDDFIRDEGCKCRSCEAGLVSPYRISDSTNDPRP